MNEDRLIEKARAFAKEGQLQRAKDILEALDSERAKSLLQKVNQAISARKQDALSQRAEKPEKPQNAPLPDYKLKAKNAPSVKEKNGTFALVTLAIVLICGIVWIMFQQSAQSAFPSREKSMAYVCRDALRGMPDSQRRLVVADETTINDWYDCLESQGVRLLEFAD
jgi:hypothetical protein